MNAIHSRIALLVLGAALTGCAASSSRMSTPHEPYTSVLAAPRSDSRVASTPTPYNGAEPRSTRYRQ